MKWQIRGIVTCSAVVVLIFIYVSNGFPSTYLGPYRYAFLVNEFRIPNQESRLVNYFLNQNSQSPLYMAFADVMQISTGEKSSWLALPAVSITGLCIVALIRPAKSIYPGLVALVAIGGPVTGLRYGFIRGALDIIFTFGFTLLLFAAIRQGNRRLIVFTSAFGSLIFWLHHYSYWPFFLTFAIVLLVLLRKFEMTFSKVVFPFLLIPLGIYIIPFQIYGRAAISAISLFQRPSLIIDQFLTFGGSQDVRNFPAYTSVPTQPNPEWTPFWLLGYLLLVFGLGLVWIWVYRADMKLVLDGDWNRLFRRPSRQFLTAVVVGMLLITPLYIFIGYFYRLATFWPVVITALGWDLHPELSEYDWQLRRTVPTFITLVLLAGLLGLHLAPAVAPGFDQDQRAATRVSDQQSASAIYSGQFVPNEKPIHTDLLHASAAISQTDRRYYLTAYAAAGAGRVGLGAAGLEMYGHRPLNGGYALVSHRMPYGTRTWGGILPPVPIAAHQNNSQIYTNGADAIYTG